MLKCDICSAKYVHKLRLTKEGWACNRCAVIPASSMAPSLSETVVLNGSYKTTKARIRELERRVILPYHDPSGGYYVGRRGENGKIQEREPRY